MPEHGNARAADPGVAAFVSADEPQHSAGGHGSPGPQPLVTRERLAELLEILERTIARRRAERGVAA